MNGKELHYYFPVPGSQNSYEPYVAEYQKKVSGLLERQEKIAITDMRPVLSFFEKNSIRMESHMDTIREKNKGLFVQKNTHAIQYAGGNNHDLSESDMMYTLQLVPPMLWRISYLETINSSFAKKVFKFQFDEDGSIDFSSVKMPEVTDKKSENPYFLIGHSDGKTINNSSIAPDLEISEEVKKTFQKYVLLHEFFHTIEVLRRSVEKREQIILSFQGKEFTFQDWWKDFEDLLLSGEEPEYISHYAKSYASSINQEVYQTDYNRFQGAVGESIADSFASYCIGGLGGEYGNVDFRTHSFGNDLQEERFKKGQTISANKKYELIDKLYHSILVKDDFNKTYPLRYKIASLTEKYPDAGFRSDVKKAMNLLVREGYIFPKILYPACGSDITFGFILPESQKYYVDPMESSQEVIQESDPNGRFFLQGFETFKEKDFDLAFIANAHGPGIHQKLPDHLKGGGLLMAEGNGWNFDASRYLGDERLLLRGVFIEKDGEISFVKENLEDYMEYISTNEFGKAVYKKMARLYLFEKIEKVINV